MPFIKVRSRGRLSPKQANPIIRLKSRKAPAAMVRRPVQPSKTAVLQRALARWQQHPANQLTMPFINGTAPDLSPNLQASLTQMNILDPYALLFAKAACKHAPNQAQSWHILAQAYYALGLHKEAVASLHQAKSKGLDPTALEETRLYSRKFVLVLPRDQPQQALIVRAIQDFLKVFQAVDIRILVKWLEATNAGFSIRKYIRPYRENTRWQGQLLIRNGIITLNDQTPPYMAAHVRPYMEMVFLYGTLNPPDHLIKQPWNRDLANDLQKYLGQVGLHDQARALEAHLARIHPNRSLTFPFPT